MKKSIIPLVFCTITHYPDLYHNRHSNIVDFIGNAKGIYILRKPLTTHAHKRQASDSLRDRIA